MRMDTRNRLPIVSAKQINSGLDHTFGGATHGTIAARTSPRISTICPSTSSTQTGLLSVSVAVMPLTRRLCPVRWARANPVYAFQIYLLRALNLSGRIGDATTSPSGGYASRQEASENGANRQSCDIFGLYDLRRIPCARRSSIEKQCWFEATSMPC
jgi:hypothetical protein